MRSINAGRANNLDHRRRLGETVPNRSTPPNSVAVEAIHHPEAGRDAERLRSECGAVADTFSRSINVYGTDARFAPQVVSAGMPEHAVALKVTGLVPSCIPMNILNCAYPPRIIVTEGCGKEIVKSFPVTSTRELLPVFAG
jgi:hypothetical protein